MLFQPLLNSISGSVLSTTSSFGAVATARIDPFICHAPPLMMCDLVEAGSGWDLTQPENIGRQVRLKEAQNAGGPLAPGNYGLLSLPDGSTGASDIEAALAAVEPDDCYTLDVTTSTGSKTQKVRDGINARFDVASGWPFPAPNVINFLRDNGLIADSDALIGDGSWDIAAYWVEKHGFAAPPVLADASRYQAYLYELGLESALASTYISPLPAINRSWPAFSCRRGSNNSRVSVRAVCRIASGRVSGRRDRNQ